MNATAGTLGTSVCCVIVWLPSGRQIIMISCHFICFSMSRLSNYLRMNLRGVNTDRFNWIVNKVNAIIYTCLKLNVGLVLSVTATSSGHVQIHHVGLQPVMWFPWEPLYKMASINGMIKRKHSDYLSHSICGASVATAFSSIRKTVYFEITKAFRITTKDIVSVTLHRSFKKAKVLIKLMPEIIMGNKCTVTTTTRIKSFTLSKKTYVSLFLRLRNEKPHATRKWLVFYYWCAHDQRFCHWILTYISSVCCLWRLPLLCFHYEVSGNSTRDQIY